MAFIDDQLKELKHQIETAIITGGEKGKESMIRSSLLINLIHDYVKQQLIDQGINEGNIYPPLWKTKPEINIAGFLKQKNQDVCVIPSEIRVKKEARKIDWGPLASSGMIDEYGFEYSTNTLVINVRSQLSSLAKNADTLFERTFAEALNLHLLYPSIVLGEVYLIPVHEYDDNLVKSKTVGFKKNATNVEKYISFFSAINGRIGGEGDYKYERVTLLIVDFDNDQPKLFRTTKQLKDDGFISKSFNIPYEPLAPDNFVKDLLSVYRSRFNIENLIRVN